MLDICIYSFLFIHIFYDATKFQKETIPLIFKALNIKINNTIFRLSLAAMMKSAKDSFFCTALLA